MANLIQNNSKLIEQQRSQINNQVESVSTAKIVPTTTIKSQSNDYRNPRTVAIIKDQSGFGFNVRGQISGEICLDVTKKVAKFNVLR